MAILKWQDAVELVMYQIKQYQVFKDEGKAEWENGKSKTDPARSTRRSKFNQSLLSSMMGDTRQDWLLMDALPGKLWTQSTLELSHDLKVGYFPC